MEEYTAEAEGTAADRFLADDEAAQGLAEASDTSSGPVQLTAQEAVSPHHELPANMGGEVALRQQRREQLRPILRDKAKAELSRKKLDGAQVEVDDETLIEERVIAYLREQGLDG